MPDWLHAIQLILVVKCKVVWHGDEYKASELGFEEYERPTSLRAVGENGGEWRVGTMQKWSWTDKPNTMTVDRCHVLDSVEDNFDQPKLM